MFPCRTVIAPETDFLSAAYEIQNMQNRIYMHSNYDPAFIMDEMRKRYNTPEHTGYESCYLTYQPMTVKVENEMLELSVSMQNGLQTVQLPRRCI